MLAAAFDVARRDRDQPVGVGVRQRPHQRRVDHPEDGEVDADAEREHHDDARRLRAPESPHCVARVLAELVEHLQAARGPQFLLQPFGAAQFDARPSACFCRRHAGAHQVLRVGLDVEPKLVGQTVLEIPAS